MRQRPAQLLLHQNFKIRRNFGGSLLKKSHAKTARPFSSKETLHLVFRSTMATGKNSLLHPFNARKVEKIILKQAYKWGIKIYELANVGNHIHLLVLAKERRLFKAFIRAVTGLIARFVLRAERGRAKNVKFWDQRPFSRIVAWKKDFDLVKKYVIQNYNEAMGLVAYRSRGFKASRSSKIKTAFG